MPYVMSMTAWKSVEEGTTDRAHCTKDVNVVKGCCVGFQQHERPVWTHEHGGRLTSAGRDRGFGSGIGASPCIAPTPTSQTISCRPKITRGGFFSSGHARRPSQPTSSLYEKAFAIPWRQSNLGGTQTGRNKIQRALPCSLNHAQLAPRLQSSTTGQVGTTPIPVLDSRVNASILYPRHSQPSILPGISIARPPFRDTARYSSS